MARFDTRKVDRLLADNGNRPKPSQDTVVPSLNARAFLRVQKEFGSFDRYLWGFVDGQPIPERLTTLDEVPARTGLSDELSADLKRRGFGFVGSTICYAFMQATGLVERPPDPAASVTASWRDLSSHREDYHRGMSGASSGGDDGTLSDLIPLVYDELRRLARGYIGRERPGQTLQPTALVNEAYLRLAKDRRQRGGSRAHFIAIAALSIATDSMVERSRRARQAQKRGRTPGPGDARRRPRGGLGSHRRPAGGR